MTSSFLGHAGFVASVIGLKSFSDMAGVGGTSILAPESRTHSSAMTLGADNAKTITAANAARLCVHIDGSPVQRCRCLKWKCLTSVPPGRGVERNLSQNRLV